MVYSKISIHLIVLDIPMQTGLGMLEIENQHLDMYFSLEELLLAGRAAVLPYLLQKQNMWLCLQQLISDLVNKNIIIFGR